jgi:peptide/nickel transport system ATP-binding protein/oligopeptide transport system ATP-binding protein
VSDVLLSVRDLRTWFTSESGPTRAVDGVSFDVHEGETVGLVGESGCGKTVTALSVLGLVPQPAGRIMQGSSVVFRGDELVGASEPRLRAIRGGEISMVFQDPMSSLNPVYSVGDQIIEALRLHRGLGVRAAREEAARLLEEVEIPAAAERLDDYPHQLSGGMQQRVMIAMALSCAPALLIADEPTTALDVTIQAQILEILARTREARGMSVLLITHDLAVVAETCDRVVVMYAGQIVESGTVDDVFTDPLHPYTRGLLDSIPSEPKPGRRLASIPGSVPSATEWPSGCRFRPRCPSAFESCTEAPQMNNAGRGRTFRCWLAAPAGGEAGE